jgi:nucleoside-diphosphate-sugar epimerase
LITTEVTAGRPRVVGDVGCALVVAASELHVVLGAAGSTGSAVVRALATRGLPVRAVTRGGPADAPEGVERVVADVGTIEGARRACEGAAVVYHCAQPDYRKWRELFPPMTQAVLDGASAAGAKLVFADNLYMYGPPDAPMTEETRQRAQGKKGRTRIEMAAALMGAHADGRLRCAIGRSSDYYGPRGTGSTAGDNVMKPALRGKRGRWLGSLDQPHTLNYLDDIARALVTLGERDEADGQVWHLPAAEPLTGRQFLALVFEAAGHPSKVGVASRPMIRIAGLFSPFLRELSETLYQFERPFVSDASKFQGAFGPFEPTPHPEAVGCTVDWFRRRYAVER